MRKERITGVYLQDGELMARKWLDRRWRTRRPSRQIPELEGACRCDHRPDRERKGAASRTATAGHLFRLCGGAGT
ncbi:MAG: hypothetical protein ACLR8P_21590 [Clostridium fessum]